MGENWRLNHLLIKMSFLLYFCKIQTPWALGLTSPLCEIAMWEYRPMRGKEALGRPIGDQQVLPWNNVGRCRANEMQTLHARI